MQDYLASRVQAGSISIDRVEERDLVLATSVQLQGQLWRQASLALDTSERPATRWMVAVSLHQT